VERARKSYANQYEKTLANHETIGVQLSEYIALGDWRLFFLSRDELDKVTPEMVAKAATAYYRRDNRVVGLFMPEDNPQRAEVPAAPTVAEVMKDFKGKEATAQSEAFEPTQANIDARTKRLAFGGVKVALLPKKNRGELVNVSIQLRLGNERDLFGKRTIAQLTGPMLGRGTTRFSREQLADEYEKLKVSGRVSGPGSNIQTTRANLEGALRLAVHVLREPTFPETEFEQLKKQSITGIQSQLSEPTARASDALAQHFNIYPKGDWRYASSLEEALANVTAVKLEDVKRFHQDFYGAGTAEIAIVGDFDEARAAAVLKELLEDWKSATPYARIDGEYRDVAPANRTIETPDKENATFLARLNVNLKDEDADFAALFVANYILGGGAASRLYTRVREDAGLAYAVGSALSPGRYGAACTVSLQTRVDGVADALRLVKDEMAAMGRAPVEERELGLAKSYLIGSFPLRLDTSVKVAATLTAIEEYDLGLDYPDRFKQAVAMVTRADVERVAARYLDPATFSSVIVGK
jgi:zinc protease